MTSSITMTTMAGNMEKVEINNFTENDNLNKIHIYIHNYTHLYLGIINKSNYSLTYWVTTELEIVQYCF